MSHVANVMLSVIHDDRSLAESFSTWLGEDCPHLDPRNSWTGCGSLNLISTPAHSWGGYKNPECAVYAGTLNGADLTAVTAKFGQIPWRFPANTQLFVMDQDQSHFRVWMLVDGGPVQYVPTRDLTMRDRIPEWDRLADTPTPDV